MITITVYGYEFRLQNNGDVQSRGKGLDWSARTAEALDITDGQLGWIQDTLSEAQDVFTEDRVPRIKVTAPEPQYVNPEAPIGVDFVQDQEALENELKKQEEEVQ